MGKLSGIKVIDLSVFLPGPMLTMMMADQGAEVIKIETATGDPAREQAPFEAGQSVWFRNLNRGKKSVVLDLKSDGGASTGHHAHFFFKWGENIKICFANEKFGSELPQHRLKLTASLFYNFLA